MLNSALGATQSLDGTTHVQLLHAQQQLFSSGRKIVARLAASLAWFQIADSAEGFCLQQVMSAQSASGARLPGETDGPDYENIQREQVPPAGPTGSVQVNGVPPVNARAASVDGDGAYNVTGGHAAAMTDGGQNDPPLLPNAAVREQMETTTAMPAFATPASEAHGGMSPAPVQASTAAVSTGQGGALIFPPSPLPGASPGGDDRPFEAVTSRAATWVQRLGEMFQQRRVEVHTSWSQSPTTRMTGDNPWSGQAPFVAAGRADDGPRDMNRTPPSTSSAAVPYDLVQAEVSRQLEGVVGDMYRSLSERLEAERARTDEAEQQAVALRAQLERMEQQAQGAPEDILPLGNVPMTMGQLGPSTTTVQEPVRPPGLFPNSEAYPVQMDAVGTRPSTLRLPGISWGAPLKQPQGPCPSPRDPWFRSVPPPASAVAGPPKASQDEGLGKRLLQGLFGCGNSTGNNEQSQQHRGPTFRTMPHQPLPAAAIPPPPAPAVASTNLAGSEQVLSAMAKGIESLLLNQGARGDRPETVKPGITELPNLPAYTPETGSIDLINWVTHITPIMEDLSDSSSQWWADTLKEVMLWYSKYCVFSFYLWFQLLQAKQNGHEWNDGLRR